MKVKIKKTDIIMTVCHIVLFICLVALTMRTYGAIYSLLFGVYTIFHAISSYKDVRRRLKGVC